jgi:hypothetical protein
MDQVRIVERERMVVRERMVQQAAHRARVHQARWVVRSVAIEQISKSKPAAQRAAGFFVSPIALRTMDKLSPDRGPNFRSHFHW